MKKILIVMVTLLSIMVLCTIRSKPRTSLEHMSSVDGTDYVGVSWKGKVYVPFCVVDNSDRGEQIGIVDDDEDNQIYKYKGYSEDEWLISFHYSGLMDNSMLMREQSVTNIPDNIYSEYEWNKTNK